MKRSDPGLTPLISYYYADQVLSFFYLGHWLGGFGVLAYRDLTFCTLKNLISWFTAYHLVITTRAVVTSLYFNQKC